MATPSYEERIREEVQKLPEEYLPALLQIVHTFRESVSLKPGEDSFRQGWEEALRGDTRPIDDLWDGIDT